MAVNYNFKKGVDVPAWHWLAQFPQGPSYHGGSLEYDGTRYIYAIIQYGTTATTASTTQLWRFDTWSNSWQYLATPTSGNQGIDLSYDPVRNVLYLMHGVALTSWQVFNLNTTSVTIANVACAAWALTTITVVLPATASVSASLTFVGDADFTTDPITTGVSAAGGSTTSIIANADLFHPGMVGTQIRVTSGTRNNETTYITAVTATTATVAPALTGALAAADTFEIRVPQGTASSGSVSTLVVAGTPWIVNQYSNADVIITGGTGSGQRRRIASNTNNTLTLAAAVTGNSRTGNFSTPPDATSTFRIVPSSDFIYYQPGNATTTFYKLDVVQTTGAAWSSALGAPAGGISGGGNVMHPNKSSPFHLVAVRGAATANVYWYNIGTNAWSTQTTFMGSETFTTGASATIIDGKSKIWIYKEASYRHYMYDMRTGTLEPAGTLPYAVASAYDGKRVKYVKTADGVEWLYHLRAGGQEFFRVPLEWL